jgi:hypothetical protein
MWPAASTRKSFAGALAGCRAVFPAGVAADLTADILTNSRLTPLRPTFSTPLEEVLRVAGYVPGLCPLRDRRRTAWTRWRAHCQQF